MPRPARGRLSRSSLVLVGIGLVACVLMLNRRGLHARAPAVTLRDVDRLMQPRSPVALDAPGTAPDRSVGSAGVVEAARTAAAPPPPSAGRTLRVRLIMFALCATDVDAAVKRELAKIDGPMIMGLRGDVEDGDM